MFGHFHRNLTVAGIEREREKESSSLVSNQRHCHYEAWAVTTWLSITFKYCLCDSPTDGCLGNMNLNRELTLNWEHVHVVSYRRYEGWEYCSDKLSIVQKNGNTQTEYHQRIIKHPSGVRWPSDGDLCFNINWLFKKHTMSDTSFSLRASTKKEEKLRVSWRKPASEQVRFTEYVAMVTDSELSWTGFVKAIR